jgi:hypothetical protein
MQSGRRGTIVRIDLEGFFLPRWFVAAVSSVLRDAQSPSGAGSLGSPQALPQLQPVDIHYDNDPDYASSPMVTKVACGVLAIGVQKDGYVHAVHVGSGGPHSNPACSYAGHNLECPRWTFPPVPSLPFQTDGHGDTRFIRAGAIDRDRVYLTSGGYNLNEIAPTDVYGNGPGRIILNRLYSLDACASDDDRIRWVFDLNGDAAGAPSVANGLIYVGADTEGDTSATPHEFYVLADTDVLPASGSVCSYPLGPVGSGASTRAGVHRRRIQTGLRAADRRSFPIDGGHAGASSNCRRSCVCRYNGGLSLWAGPMNERPAGNCLHERGWHS